MLLLCYAVFILTLSTARTHRRKEIRPIHGNRAGGKECAVHIRSLEDSLRETDQTCGVVGGLGARPSDVPIAEQLRTSHYKNNTFATVRGKGTSTFNINI